MAQFAKIEELPTLVRHEIGELRRLRKELSLSEHIAGINNLSLMVLYSKYLEKEHVDSISASMRESDVIIPLGNHILCFLPGTDKEGAIHLAEGIKDFLSEEGYYVIATYPEDGESYEELVDSLRVYSEQKGKPLPVI